MVHAVGADVLLDVGVLVVVDPEAGVAGCLRQVGDQTRFSNGSLALPKKAASGDFFVENTASLKDIEATQPRL